MCSQTTTAPLPELYQMSGQYESYDSLEMAPGNDAQAKRLTDLFSTARFGRTWKRAQVIVRKNDEAADFYYLAEGVIAVSGTAKKVLSPLIGNSVDFLPLSVVGEKGFDTLDDTIRPAKLAAKLFVLRPLVHIELGPNAGAYYYDSYTYIHDYALEPRDVEGQHLFHVIGDTYLLISNDVRSLIKKAKLKGVYIDEPVDWSPSTTAATATPKVATKPRKQVAAPKAFDFEKLAGRPRITNSVW